jgi:SAM-dependent methyltransferase
MRGRYGFDAPHVLIGLALGAPAEALAAAGCFVLGWWPAGLALTLGTGYLAASASSFAYTTVRGKFLVWQREIDRATMHGDEITLDLGPGRGMVLILTALRLPTGRSYGVDLWRGKDQSGNAPDAARANADANGVGARVGLATGDIRDLPFRDGTFDLVTSSLTVHNIDTDDGRAAAVTEALRVLRPGGRLLLADFRHTDAYARTLRGAGAQDVTVRNLGWRFWYGAPWFATRMVSGTKLAG